MFTQKDFSCRPVGEKPPPHKFPQIVKKSNKKNFERKKTKNKNSFWMWKYAI